MFQHDIEFTERFARENPDVIANAREKLMVCTVMYRCENFHIYFPGKYLGEIIPCPVCGAVMRPKARMKTIPVYRFRCPCCRRRLSWPKESYTGRAFEAGQHLYCGDCALHRGGNYKLVLINKTRSPEEETAIAE